MLLVFKQESLVASEGLEPFSLSVRSRVSFQLNDEAIFYRYFLMIRKISDISVSFIFSPDFTGYHATVNP